MSEHCHEPLSDDEIDSKMEAQGYAELSYLWQTFKRMRVAPTPELESRIRTLRNQHTGFVASHPILVTILCAVAGWSVYWYLGFIFEGIDRSVNRHPVHIGMKLLTAALGAYVFLFAATLFQRVWVHSWKKISALDLASMLRKRDYRAWFDEQPDALAVMKRLGELGVSADWDNPAYCRHYTTTSSGVQELPDQYPRELLANPPAFIQHILREVLGTKENKKFVKGRFTGSLKEDKKSVTQFVQQHQADITRNKNGELPVSEGKKLLSDLLTYMKPGKGHRHVQNAIEAVDTGRFLDADTVEARIWQRDPWVDLTRQTDFFSSASLRGPAWSDAIKRKTKGLLGPFGYLRNKSITALDFSTNDGRSVRARMAAAVLQDDDGKEQAVLFVDGVEGRFDIKPRLIKRAIEDYAKAAGFTLVVYYALPLNQVPQRFVRHVKSTGAIMEELAIAYADCTSGREYLDAFGLPFEPFEYAYPKGKVFAYVVNLARNERRTPRIPSRVKVLAKQAVKKYSLWVMSVAALCTTCWVIWIVAPHMVWLVAVVGIAALLHEFWMHRRSIRAGKN